MKKFIVLFIILFSINVFAFDGEKQLISNLTKYSGGNIEDEVLILEKEYKLLFDNKECPICEVMKISIDLKYNPYIVLKLLYSMGQNVELDELCSCATEAGINKSIIARSAVDSVNTFDNPIFDRDEIIQSQCLSGEKGLGYTPEQNNVPPPSIKSQPQQKYSPYGN